MTKGQKVALRHAANAIDGTRPVGGVKLGANDGTIFLAVVDRKARPFAVTYLARRIGPGRVFLLPAVKATVQSHYGLTEGQVEKLEKVAASTHNLKQRAERVAAFLRRVAQDPSYVGLPSRQTTGAVAATL